MLKLSLLLQADLALMFAPRWWTGPYSLGLFSGGPYQPGRGGGHQGGRPVGSCGKDGA